MPVAIYHAENATFDFTNCDDVALSCDKSVAHNSHGLDDVLNDGRRQGIVKKFLKTEKARAKICRLEIAKTILEFVTKFESQLNLPRNLREVVKNKNLKYCQMKSECKSDIFDKQNEIVENFFPKSDARICRRKKLDNFSLYETAKTNKNDKLKVLKEKPLSGGKEGAEKTGCGCLTAILCVKKGKCNFNVI